MDSQSNDSRQSKKQLQKKRLTPLNLVKSDDWKSMFKIEDTKKVKKFDGVDDSKALLSHKNSSTDFVLASLLEFLCSIQGNDKKASQSKFQDISSFLIDKDLLSPSSTLDEFQGLRANISKILFNLLFFKQIHVPLNKLPQNIQIYERYKLEFDDEGHIGKGGFGSVRKAINKLDGRHYAIKKIWLKDNDSTIEIKRILDEVKTLACLKHKNIVGYNSAWLEQDIFMTGPSNEGPEMERFSYSGLAPNAGFQKLNIKELDSSFNSSDSSESSDNQLCNSQGSPLIYKSCKTLYIQMELCEQTLEDWLNSRNSEDDKPLVERIDTVNNLKILQETVEGLEFIHSRGIIHRDIKPANIFLKENFSVKIGDFGLAKRSYTSDSDVTKEDFVSLSVGVGTSTYSAPEQLNSSNYDTKSDIYSLGLIIYELYYSFTTMSERTDLFNVLKENSKIDNLVVQNFPDQAELIKKMTKKDPAERLTAQNILSQYLCTSKDDIIREQKREIACLKNRVKELELLLHSHEERMRTEK
ncbi:eukaryotic translation initiation factor 2-alpha kinase 1 isoform X2 [Octopus bimaculoides]|uniref:eukaryotic translation initiation factor 2-alpha kinase 1 isoform X2 n=1 Tax=Octopus bimaculoides TaxID=37653 RepID=UPI00071CBD7A|nr:eukaryotic translation initiation factor 2-alpha kinase 1 isoform X2 [Octopus bimaculoides]|eukprot:XP_014790567.1 PREDICTED: eukaryotic translation initiation factor 2-alpha kinase 1-like isoform X2 [Octopus bimaculoides]